MIFMTVGTILPFDRLVRALDAWAANHSDVEVFGQLGDLEESSYRPAHFPWTDRITPMEFRAKVSAADVVVTHAGIGTIVTALTHATPVLMMPRRTALGEHVNDHQLETVSRFATRSGVTVAHEPEEIGPHLDNLLRGSGEIQPLPDGADPRLITAIQGLIHGKMPS